MDHYEPPLTPMDRYFVQPKLNFSTTLSVTFENPTIDIQTLKNKVGDLITDRKLPTPFFSLLVRDSHGRERWRETLVDVDRHFIIINSPSPDAENKEEEDFVNDYISYISSSRPLSRDKPLWEIHILEAQRTAIFHGSHAIGDGISMMTLLTSCCRRADDGGRLSPPDKVSVMRRRDFSMLTWVRYVRNSLLFVSGFSLRGICGVGDGAAAYASGGGGGGRAELAGDRRKLATARFQMRDMEIVKGAVPGATINDVLFGIISCGLSRYLSQNAKKDNSRISGTVFVNLRQHLDNKVQRDHGNLGIWWGNIIGICILPIVGYCNNPLEYVKRAKHMLDQRKLSIEATFSNKIASFLISLLGTKVASYFFHRTIRTTTFATSNLIGPKDKVAIASNPINCMTITSNSQPHAVISIVMHLLSYAGVGYMQISVVEEVIEDPKSLAKCFQDVLLEMKQMC